MELMQKGSAEKGIFVDCRLKWGWESVSYHICLSLKHLNYLRGKDESSISTSNLSTSYFSLQ